MEKLFNLKQWLTVPDAARHLSIVIGEDVSEPTDDVLRLALEGHLTLSVYFVNHTSARCGPIVSRANAKRHTVPAFDNFEATEIVEGGGGWRSSNRMFAADFSTPSRLGFKDAGCRTN